MTIAKDRPAFTGAPTLLSTDRYTSSTFALREARELWSRVWQMACRLEEIPEVGDYLEYVIADQSYLVVRADDRTVKAYSNACRHRGTQLKQGRGHAAELRCSFHAWCWELTGECREITDPADFGDPDLSELALPECRVALWGGFVFINPDPNAVDFEPWIKPVDDDCDPYKLADMRYMSVLSTVVPANWKISVEAFIESYHIFATHPQVSAATDGTYATFECAGDHGLMVVPMGRSSARLDLDDESEIIDQMVEAMMALAQMPRDQVSRLRRIADGEEELRDTPLRDVFIAMGKERAVERGYDDPRFATSQYWDQHEWHVFPNLVLGLIPGEMFGFRFRPDGLNPDSSIFEVLSMRFPQAEPKPATMVEVPYTRDPEEARAAFGPILHQDFANLEKVQRGLHSARLSHTRISGYQEQLIAHMHKTIDSYLGEGAE
jgi:phenylpropionate dioxygenase-like ring-hydroxylating dioxygenase large terminal subunit